VAWKGGLTLVRGCRRNAVRDGGEVREFIFPHKSLRRFVFHPDDNRRRKKGEDNRIRTRASRNATARCEEIDTTISLTRLFPQPG
jgi:hypothetical protein